MSCAEHAKEDKAQGFRADIKRAQEGDAGAKERLLRENAGLIRMVVRRFRGYPTDAEDLAQIGAIGLLRAIDRFDLSTDYAFSTYAVPMIFGEIRRFLRDDGAIHVSRGLKEQARRIAAYREEFGKRFGREPTIDEIHKATGIQREELLMAMEASAGVDSIDRSIRSAKGGMPEEGMTLGEMLQDKENLERRILLRYDLSRAFQALGEEDKRLIALRYLEGKTQTQTAELLGMNQVAVSRREKKILLSMRRQLQ